MSEFENMEAMELNTEEMEEVSGGKYKPLPPKRGWWTSCFPTIRRSPTAT